VTHSYPLYVAVLAQCYCCRSLQPFTFTSVTDQVVCASCLHHLGAEKAERRDAEHVELWVGQFAEQQDKHRRYAEKTQATIAEKDEAIAALTGQVDGLRSLVAGRFDNTPIGGVRGILESDLVKRAERKTELAQRQIDWAMAVIWRVGTLHHVDEKSPLTCICGRSAAGCAEGKAIDPLRQAMLEWEKKNLRLLRDGKRNGLPDDHPAVLALRKGAR
jgi:hypothetical protein